MKKDCMAASSAGDPNLNEIDGFFTASFMISCDWLPNLCSISASSQQMGSSGDRSKLIVSRICPSTSIYFSVDWSIELRALSFLKVTGQTSLNLVTSRRIAAPISQSFQSARGILRVSNLSRRAIPRKRVLLLNCRVEWARQNQSIMMFLWGRQVVRAAGRVFLGTWVAFEPLPLKGMNLISGTWMFGASIFQSF